MSKKISALTELDVDDVLDSDFFAIVNNGQTKKVTKESFISSGLQAIKDFYTYDFFHDDNIQVTSDAYEEIGRLTTPSRSAGTYTVTNSMLYSYDNTNRSAFFRFSLDGGVNWTEIRKEPKDNADKLPESYTTTIVTTGAKIFDIIIQAKTEDVTDALTVYKLDIMLEKKK